MISSRYALLVALLLAVALIPTAIHSYLNSRVDDGRYTKSIPRVFGGFSFDPINQHKAQKVKGVFDSEDWIDRIYGNSTGLKVRLFVARSYDYKRLYHHPELGLSRGTDLRLRRVFFLTGKPEMPIHLLRNRSGRGLVGYVLLHDGKFIKDPLIYQFHNALKQLFSPRKAMTLFYVSDSVSTDSADFSETSAAFILGEAVKNFQTSMIPLAEVE